MRRWIQAVAMGGALLSSRVAEAQTYNFLVNYFGGGNAALASGSDNMVGTNILPGDSYHRHLHSKIDSGTQPFSTRRRNRTGVPRFIQHDSGCHINEPYGELTKVMRQVFATKVCRV